MVRQLREKDAAAYRALRLVALQTEPDVFCSDFAVENNKPELFLEKCLKEGADLPFGIKLLTISRTRHRLVTFIVKK